MKPTGFFFLFLCFLFLSIGCNQKSKQTEIKLISKGIFEIPIDEQTSKSWSFIETYEDKNGEYLVFHDFLKTEPRFIHFVNIRDTTQSFNIPLAINGPNGIGHLDGFYVRNLDSIFVLNRYAYQLNLVDSSGKVKDTYRLRADDSNEPALDSTLPFPWTFAPIIDLGEMLLIPSYPDAHPFKQGYKQKNLAIALDPKSKEFEYKLGFSDKYFSSGFWGVFLETPSYTVNYRDSVIIQSFPIDDRVFVFDFDLNLINSPSLFKNYYSDKFHSLPDLNMERDVFYPNTYSNPSNKAIIYDPYRQLYYRTYQEAYSQEAIDEMLYSSHRSLKEQEQPRKIIQVMDSDFNELGVVFLEKEKYWIDDIQVVRDGLLIWIDTDDEDKKIFEIFEVEY
ncbi:DUF4221 family protein [Algoriphagus hitonicola]|uniref:TolB-like 6-blade propeller-like n=1 Tax=Algoriphagus hitonicola TaxID=435880 RepID=A0A1I2S7B0_9BACT|nr:DUF4221 family protein [Algoriphagus hitonicola]SFG47609.1 protein of unknown function [Algoriphagus hitonicola]